MAKIGCGTAEAPKALRAVHKSLIYTGIYVLVTIYPAQPRFKRHIPDAGANAYPMLRALCQTPPSYIKDDMRELWAYAYEVGQQAVNRTDGVRVSPWA